MMRRRMLIVVAMLALAATGCFKADIKVVINDDGSGRLEGLSAINVDAVAELSALFEEEGAEAPTREELCADFASDNEGPEGATTEPYDEGDFCGVRFFEEFTAEEMDEALAEMSDDGGDFVIRRDGEGWRFDATLSDEASGDTEFLPEEFFDDAEFIVRVKLPGRQVEHNADRIESDGTMVWDVDLFNPGPALMARTEPGETITGSGRDGDDGGNTALIVVLVVLAVAAVGGFLWWRNRSGSSGPGGPETPASEPALAASSPGVAPPPPADPAGPPPAAPPPGAPAGPPPAAPPPADPPPAV